MAPDGTLARKLAAEFIGTAWLLAAVVGSGIMGERLAAGNVALALLANTLATGAALVAIVLTFGPVSGAHLNPAVTIADATQGGVSWPVAVRYIAVQIAGALMGVVVAHLMFEEAVIQTSQTARNGPAQVFSEFVAAFGLLSVIWGTVRSRLSAVPFAVGAYITSAYWFTASTSFANPAVTVGRGFTDTFTGIRPLDVPWFVAAQIIGALLATYFFRWLAPSLPEAAPIVTVPHQG
jgi:glycerol uptake facilitator-like aquaporin